MTATKAHESITAENIPILLTPTTVVGALTTEKGDLKMIEKKDGAIEGTEVRHTATMRMTGKVTNKRNNETKKKESE